jgi:hypothetical protein
MTVYSKTMAGRMAAVDQQSGLTLALKDFLKSVDGKTPPEQLVARWRDGPDALQLLHELERRGLVEVRAVRWSNSAANSAFPPSLVDSKPAASAPPHRTIDPTNASSSTSSLTPSLASAPAPSTATHKEPKTRTLAGLDAIKEQMATFMLTHLPHHAIAVLKEIEEIDSYDRLMLMLSAYANMAHEAGRTGLAHIKSLRAMLEPGFQNTAH